jgi:hypothetical protein
LQIVGKTASFPEPANLLSRHRRLTVAFQGGQRGS